MNKGFQLSREDRLHFMRALYSVFRRDHDVNEVEQRVLDTLNQIFCLHANDYKHYVHVNTEDIANEINAVADIRVRIYFLRIIHDVYRKEVQVWFKGPESGHAIKFRSMYAKLESQVKFS